MLAILPLDCHAPLPFQLSTFWNHETVLYHQSLQYALTRGYAVCENSWLLENNLPVIQASEFMGGREYRRYRIYDKSLLQGGTGRPHD